MNNTLETSQNNNIAQTLAQALQLEQVKFLKQQLHGPDAELYLRQFIQQTYTQLERIQLKDIIQVGQIQEVVQRYAFEMNLGPEILELIGVIAQKIHVYVLKSNACFNDLISDQQFEMWLAKIVELQPLRQYIHQFILSSQPVKQLCLQIATQIIESKTPWLNQLRHGTLQPKQHFAQQLMGFLQDQHLNLEQKLELKLAALIQQQLSEILLMPNDEIIDLAILVWNDIKKNSLYSGMSKLQAIDIEEFFVLIYESWRDLREGAYIQNLIQYAVEVFLDYFADYDLQALLNAVGLSVEDLYHEGLLFSPSSFKALDQAGILDPILNCLLAPFYQQRAVALIESHLTNTTL